MAQESGSKNQPFVKPVGRWAIAVVVAGALATSGVTVYNLYALREAAQQPVPAVEPSTPPKLAVTALGRLEPQGEVIKLSAPMSVQGAARVDQLLVGEGDKVTKGQVVAILDNRDRLQAALDKAKQQVKVAQADLNKVKAGAQTGEITAQKAAIARTQEELRGRIASQQATVARLEAELQGEKNASVAKIARLTAQMDNAKKEFERYEQLYQQGAVGASLFDTKRLEVETALRQLNETQATANQKVATLEQQINEAKATAKETIATLEQQINEAKATLEKIAEIRPVDVQAAQAEIENAIASVKQAQADLESAYVRVPVAGQVLKVHTRPGETIGNNGIVEIGQTDLMVAVAEIYESDIGKVRLGQQATINSEGNAFADELKGTVNQIGLQIGKKDILNTDPAADVDARVVEVKIRLNAESSRRVAGLTNSKVTVKIHI